jgi:4-amino-4-deoxy-L-arabinose transferase-like glycosyltransferase
MSTLMPRPALGAPPPETTVARRLRLPAWLAPAVLLTATAVLYLWGLGASGYGNDFYAAASQAGSLSWKAFFFGSLDPSNAITVDKPPASLWVSGLSVRLFGLSSWSILVPQALEGVAAVALLYAAVRRTAGRTAGLVAGAVLALTPVATLMFRFNNPDALLVLLLVASAYTMVRALEGADTRWILAAGALIGLAFLTKMLQAFLVLPAFALVYAVAAPTTLWRRCWQLLAGAAAVVVAAGWWVAIVELWPAASRPYIGGSTTNSVLDLAFGYNGLQRLSSSGGPGGGFSGAADLTRLFNSLMGGEISWLLPAALAALAGGLWLTRGAPRTDRVRAALLLWGGWLLVTGLVFSFMTGVVHTYYTVALAPAVGALVAIGGRELWLARHLAAARFLAAAGVASSGIWAFVLLERTPSWHPELRYLIAAATVVAVLLLLDPRAAERGRGIVAVTAVAAALALLAGPAGYSLATAATPHTGSTPSSGPAGAVRAGAFGGGAPGGGRPAGAPTGSFAPPSGGAPPTGAPPAGAFPASRGGSGRAGGLTASSALVTLLRKDAGLQSWAAATVGSMSAAPLQLASGEAVMAIGGFTGSDPSPTLAQFKALVSAHRIHWFVAGGGMGGGPGGAGSGSGSSIASWVTSHYSAHTVGGQTVYDLTAATTS